jgi:C4-type Zn-finger protein
MSTEIICVGYKCPVCHQRVPVMRSCDAIPHATDIVQSECKCGYGRTINLTDVQQLEVWRELGESSSVGRSKPSHPASSGGQGAA